MAQAYYRKWRPRDWDQVIGQDHVICTLRNAFARGNFAHAYLFSGPRGTGKTTTARIIAKALNCLSEDQSTRPCNQCEHCVEINQARFLDLIEIDAASNTSVDDVRDLREKINFSPTKGRYKVYIIDEVHMLSNAAFNALLKTLEEPPAHAVFILATTEVQKIPPTVLSRCQRHEFRRIPLNFIQLQLKEIAEKEGIEVDPAALTAIARQATGSMRDAVSLLDQLASTGSAVNLELTKQVMGTAGGENVYALVNAILNDDAGEAISQINLALDRGSDPRQFGRQVADVLRSVLMAKIGNSDQIELTLDETEKINNFAAAFPMGKLLAALREFDRAAQRTNAGWQPGLQLELAAAKIANTVGNQERTNLNASTTKQKEKGVQRNQAVLKEKRVESGSSVNESKTSEKNLADSRSHSEPEPEENDNQSVEDDISAERDPDISNRKGSDSGSVGINQIKSTWKEIRAAAKEKSPETAALLNSSRSMNIRRGRLVLGFASELLRSKMENGRNIELAREAIRNVCGVDVEIDCMVAGKEENPVPDGMEVDRDGMVGEALSLGGKITRKTKAAEEEE